MKNLYSTYIVTKLSYTFVNTLALYFLYQIKIFLDVTVGDYFLSQQHEKCIPNHLGLKDAAIS